MTDNLIRDRSQEPGQAIVTLQSGKKMTIPMQCEFIVATGSSTANYGIIFDVRGIALWSQEIDELGFLSIGGPIRRPKSMAQPEHGGGALYGLALSLYYSALTSYVSPGPKAVQREPENEKPLMEYLEGDIKWRQEVEGTRRYALFYLDLRLSRSLLGSVTQLEFESPPLFEWHQPDGSEHWYSAPISYPTVNFNHDPEGPKTLRMRFVAVNADGAVVATNAAQLNTLIQQWLNRWIAGVKEIWGTKANLCLDIKPQIDIATVGALDTAIVANEIEIPIRAGQELDRLDVYLVKNLNEEQNNGGVKRPPSAVDSNSYIILQVNQNTATAEYDYLLAHELGHVLGLKHPEYPFYGQQNTIWRGAYGSIMMPSDNVTHTASPPVNPLSNLQILAEPSSANQLAAILLRDTAAPTADCQNVAWSPDPEPWFVWGTHQPLLADYNDFNNAKLRYEDGQTKVKPKHDHLTGPVDRTKAHVCVRLSDLQLQHRPVRVCLFLVNSQFRRLDNVIDAEEYFLTFYEDGKVVEARWLPLKEADLLAESAGFGIAAAELDSQIRQRLRDEMSWRKKTRSVRWNIDPSIHGVFDLFAIVQDSKPDSERHSDEVTLIQIATKQTPLTAADANTLKNIWSSAQNDPAKRIVQNYIKSIRVDIPLPT